MTAPKPRPRVVVLGDLVLDVVLAPDRPMVAATDVPGRVGLRQGGSAANTARWLARLGARVTLISAVGRDGVGRALVDAVRRDGVTPRVVRVSGTRTGRIGVAVAPGGERSFVADRGAADLLRPTDLRAEWFAGVELVHLPAYSLLGSPLGDAGRRASELAHEAGAVVTVDLASVGPLLAAGRRRAIEIVAAAAPDLLFATASEARALAGDDGAERLLRIAPALVLKRGSAGATLVVDEAGVPHRRDIPTRALDTTDTTGAGDAFDAGFIVAWLAARRDGMPLSGGLRRATIAGHRAAARHLAAPREELRLG
jgi:sugar/nucleoside kinase (ribokinase family)